MKNELPKRVKFATCYAIWITIVFVLTGKLSCTPLALGTCSNVMAVLFNNNRMPSIIADEQTKLHKPIHGAKFRYLCDIIRIRIPYVLNAAASVGDVLIVLGVILSLIYG